MLILLLCGSFYSFDIVAKDKSRHVILITIDGMRKEMVTDSVMPAPNLKRIKENGLFVERIYGITPTATYPSHTTIITGKKPNEHAIYYNSPFLNNEAASVSYWYADSIKAPTIWDRVSESGMIVASLFWPVSVGAKSIHYNIPEFWSVTPVDNQLEFLKPFCTPAGLLGELEVEATGKINHENFGAGSLTRDAKTAHMANYIMNKYRPNFMSIHLITTDYAQHATGLNSERTYAAVGGADHAVGLIIENLERNKLLENTTVIVCGDHGFVDTNVSISPNTWLVEEGLLTPNRGEEWEACFHGAGAMMFLYLKEPDNKQALKKVFDKLDSLPSDVRSLFRIIEKKELAELGCDPKVEMAIEPINGVAVTNNRTGNDVLVKRGGKHGYSSGIDPTTLVAFGKGVDKEVIESMQQTGIYSLVLELLGIDK